MLLEPATSKVWFNWVLRQQHIYSPFMKQTHQDETQPNKIIAYSTVIIGLIYTCIYSPWEDTLDVFLYSQIIKSERHVLKHEGDNGSAPGQEGWQEVTHLPMDRIKYLQRKLICRLVQQTAATIRDYILPSSGYCSTQKTIKTCDCLWGMLV